MKNIEFNYVQALLCCIIQKDRHLAMLLVLLRNRPNADYSFLAECFKVS